MSQHYWWAIPEEASSGTFNTTWGPLQRSDERVTLQREVSFEFASDEGDGRTLYSRIVPYGVPTKVRDNGGPEYTEVWVAGAFDKQLRAANRILLNFEHEPGIRGVIGRGVELRSPEDGLHGTFRILDNTDGDKALQLIRDEVVTGMSLEAIALKSDVQDGIVYRKDARLQNVAICRTPAFEDARILAVREGDDEPEPDPAPDPDPDPDEPAKESPIIVPELRSALERVQHGRVEEALARVGYESLVQRAVTNRPWDGSPSRFTDEEYQRSCLIDRGGDTPPKTRCSLPVLEPNGDLNINGMHAAAGRLNQVTGISPAMRAAAARKLIRYYRQAGEDPPPNITNLAGR